MDNSEILTLDLDHFFAPNLPGVSRLKSAQFERREVTLADQDSAILDVFPTTPGASCCFLRLHKGAARTLRFRTSGAYRLQAGESGGWLLMPADTGAPAYWFPQPPILRCQDALGHVLAERPVSLTGLHATPADMSIDLRLPADWHLDWVVWRFSPEARELATGLGQILNIERRPYFLWGSKVNFILPAGVYQYLLHGHVYTNDFVWPRNWKFHSELDAYGLYLALDGLHLATGKALYGLMKRQMLYSVITAQAEDGGWYQGEWTDLMESHYRLHNAAMLMLTAGLEEFDDDIIRTALAKAAAFLSTCADQTDIGHWFLHDSLENSAEAMEEMRRQTKTPWIPSRTLGKSATNKLILNTHLDAIIALDRYQALTGDNQYAGQLDSARTATRTLLNLRPAEMLYRLLYWAIGLTLLPKDEAMRLPFPLRVLKRFTWMHLTPQMHRVKRFFPRLVMPGGLIERHLAPLHYDINYHPVNVMDLARYWRRFPAEDLSAVIAEAVKAVAGGTMLEYWAEAKPRQFAIVTWVDALYHLCTLNPDQAYRRHLVQAMLKAQDLGLGLPPSLLGGDAEVAGRTGHQPCPSPANPALMIANLSRSKLTEILVVNPTGHGLELAWESGAINTLTWTDAAGQPLPGTTSNLVVPGRSWIQGRESTSNG
jgi:hypothetical protein